MSDQDNGLPAGWVFVDEPAMAVSYEQKPDTSTGIKLAAAGSLVPRAATAAMEMATNPNVAKVAGTVGKVIGATAAPVVGAMKGGPLGALAGAAEMGKAAWAGGGTGWFTGKTLQSAAMPVAKALEAVKPYAQALSTLGGAAGVGDLAQMAEPNRKDIGFLGLSTNGPPIDPSHPPLINEAIAKIAERMGRPDIADLWRGKNKGQ